MFRFDQDGQNEGQDGQRGSVAILAILATLLIEICTPVPGARGSLGRALFSQSALSLTGGPDSPQSRRLFGREHESCNDPRRRSFSHPFAELVMPTATVPRTDSRQTELQQTLERLAADIHVLHRDVLRELRLEFV
jgi:hypothetical protein